jgi:DNA-binding NarL/FixJ family response regulator
MRQQSAHPAIRVLIACDHHTLAWALGHFLNQEAGFHVDVSGEEADAVLATAAEQPHILLLAHCPPTGRSLTLAPRLLAGVADLRVVVLTDSTDAGGYLRPLLDLGLWAFLRKSDTPEAIRVALRAVAGGRRLPIRGLVGAAVPSVWEPLTAREVEVLWLWALDQTDVHIAKILRVSVRTIEFHGSNVRGKLGATTHAGAVSQAYRFGLTIPPDLETALRLIAERAQLKPA